MYHHNYLMLGSKLQFTHVKGTSLQLEKDKEICFSDFQKSIFLKILTVKKLHAQIHYDRKHIAFMKL